MSEQECQHVPVINENGVTVCGECGEALYYGDPRSGQKLHDHYARNHMACGHESSCATVTTFVNWPTLWGRPSCTCRVGGNTDSARRAVE